MARVLGVAVEVPLEERLEDWGGRADECNVDFNCYEDPEYETFPCEPWYQHVILKVRDEAGKILTGGVVCHVHNNIHPVSAYCRYYYDTRYLM